MKYTLLVIFAVASFLFLFIPYKSVFMSDQVVFGKRGIEGQFTKMRINNLEMIQYRGLYFGENESVLDFLKKND